MQYYKDSKGWTLEQFLVDLDEEPQEIVRYVWENLLT